MTMNEQPVFAEEEMLQKFVDGELTSSEYRDMRNRMDASDALSQRVAEFQVINSLVAGMNKHVLEEPMPEEFSVTHRPVFAIGNIAIAASMLLLVVGVLFAWMQPFRSLNDDHFRLVAAAAAAHELYAGDVLHPVEVDAKDTEHLGKWLSKHIGKDFVPPAVEGQGLRLMGGRILPGDDISPHGLLMYEQRNGQRVSVYIMNTGDQAHTSTLFSEQSGLGVFYWIDEELSCAVVFAMNSDFDYDHSLELSNLIYEELEL